MLSRNKRDIGQKITWVLWGQLLIYIDWLGQVSEVTFKVTSEG